MTAQRRITPHGLNWLLFFVGMAIVWFASHNWIAMAGAWVASIHITFRVPD